MFKKLGPRKNLNFKNVKIADRQGARLSTYKHGCII